MLLLIAWLMIAGFGLPWPLYVVAYVVWVVSKFLAIPVEPTEIHPSINWWKA